MEDRVEHNPPARVNPPPPLNIKRGGYEWKHFKQMWQNYSIVAKIVKLINISMLYSYTLLDRKHWHSLMECVFQTHTHWKILSMVLMLISWERLTRHMNAMYLIAETKVEQNLLKTTLLLYVLCQKHASLWLHERQSSEGPHSTWYYYQKTSTSRNSSESGNMYWYLPMCRIYIVSIAIHWMLLQVARQEESSNLNASSVEKITLSRKTSALLHNLCRCVWW